MAVVDDPFGGPCFLNFSGKLAPFKEFICSPSDSTDWQESLDCSLAVRPNLACFRVGRLILYIQSVQTKFQCSRLEQNCYWSTGPITLKCQWPNGKLRGPILIYNNIASQFRYILSSKSNYIKKFYFHSNGY